MSTPTELLQHYITNTMRAAGLSVDSDTYAELAELVDGIVEDARQPYDDLDRRVKVLESMAHPEIPTERENGQVEEDHPSDERDAEEADIENKAVLVEEFSETCKYLIELIDDLDAEAMLPEKTPADHRFWDELRDQVSTAAYQFAPDLDDHSLEDLS